MWKFPGEEKATPTCLEDCSDSTIRGWLMKEGDVEMAKRTLENLEGTFDRLLQYLHEDEVKMVKQVIDERVDKPVSLFLQMLFSYSSSVSR